MPDLQMSPVVLRLALRVAGAGGLRCGFEFPTGLGFLILVAVWRFKCGLSLLLL
jgi:hypothetical protein